MNRSESLIAARIYFLERELERMSCAADTTEHELRARPMDAATVRKLLCPQSRAEGEEVCRRQ